MKELTDTTLLEIRGTDQEAISSVEEESREMNDSAGTKLDDKRTPSLVLTQSKSNSSRTNENLNSSSKDVNFDNAHALASGTNHQPATSTSIEATEATYANDLSRPVDDGDDENESLASRFFAMMLNEAHRLEDTVTTSLMSPTRRVEEQVNDEIGDVIVTSNNPETIIDEVVEIQINGTKHDIFDKTDCDDAAEEVDLISATRSKSGSSNQDDNETFKSNKFSSPSPMKLVNGDKRSKVDEMNFEEEHSPMDDFNQSHIKLQHSESISLTGRVVVDEVEKSRTTSQSPPLDVETIDQASANKSRGQSGEMHMQIKRNSISSRSGQISLKSFANSRQSKTSNRSNGPTMNETNKAEVKMSGNTIEFSSAIAVQSNLAERSETKGRSNSESAVRRDRSDMTVNDATRPNRSQLTNESGNNDTSPLMSNSNAMPSEANLQARQRPTSLDPHVDDSSSSSPEVASKSTGSILNVAITEPKKSDFSFQKLPGVDSSIGLSPTVQKMRDNEEKQRSKSVGASNRDTSVMSNSRFSIRSSSPAFRVQNTKNKMQSPRYKQRDSLVSAKASECLIEPKGVKSSNASIAMRSLSSGKSNRSLGDILKQTLKSKLRSQLDELNETHSGIDITTGVNEHKIKDFDWERNSVIDNQTEGQHERLSDHQSVSNFSHNSTSKFWEEAKKSQNNMRKWDNRKHRLSDGSRSYSLDHKLFDRPREIIEEQAVNVMNDMRLKDNIQMGNNTSTDASKVASINDMSIVRKATSFSSKSIRNQATPSERSAKNNANRYSDGASRCSRSNIESLRERLKGVQTGNDLGGDEVSSNVKSVTSAASDTKTKKNVSEQGSATQSSRYMQSKPNMIPNGLRAKSVPRSQFLKSKVEAKNTQENMQENKAWRRARSLSLQRSSAADTYQANVPLTFMMNASDYDGSTLTTRGYESRSSQRSDGDKDVSTLTEDNTSIGDPWEDITGASRIIVDAINRIETVTSEDTDYESTADQVEQALETLESYATSLGIKERELLLLAINNERNNETDSADARLAFASDLLNFIRQNTDTRSLQLQLMGSSEFSLDELSQS
jgi:hypothetical protein